jgi:hypothetical protein
MVVKLCSDIEGDNFALILYGRERLPLTFREKYRGDILSQEM